MIEMNYLMLKEAFGKSNVNEKVKMVNVVKTVVKILLLPKCCHH